MTVIETLLLALALGADAFSVAVAVGLTHASSRQLFRLSWHFGLFQALMPFLGAVGGAFLLRGLGAVDHWVAFAVLALLGGKMLWESSTPALAPGSASDPTRGWSLVGLSVATSLDAFGAGSGLAMTRASLWVSCPLIGIVTAFLTLAGMRLGSRLTRFAGRWAAAGGGLVLFGLGIRMLRI